ncbi:MAG: GTPase Era [Candidatus Eisenbacteria bacterium]|uniref:GTPase Era n=1 Tax=Eiseniibacteriota bacterium TaxID=2212470 RepID=A0A937X8X7_UNCEI|nr:GTPase Era [Candidatus Eisenbacteria bacterium]
MNDEDIGREPAAPPGAAGETPFRSGYAAICGPPNAGKSTLLNRLIGERLAITTSRPQTTRRRMLGILSGEGFQIVFVDTPGILEPRYALQSAMMKEVGRALADADLLLLVTDIRAAELAPGVFEAARRKPLVVALNKADLVADRETSLPILDRLRAQAPEAEFFVLSALRGGGVDALRARLIELLPAGAPFYPPDQLTEHPERFFASELVREAIFERFHQEVPYSTEVQIDEFKERDAGKDYIAATIFVESESQKGILIGRGGRAIRDLGHQARGAIESFLGRPVYLELRVKVLPDWRKDPRALRRFGY